MKDDEYKELEIGVVTPSLLSRRQFIKLLGGGILISFTLGDL